MHINTLRAGVERGEAQIGTWLTLVHNPMVLQLMKSAGLDFARVDREHTGLTIDTVAQMAVLARAIAQGKKLRAERVDFGAQLRLRNSGRVVVCHP